MEHIVASFSESRKWSKIVGIFLVIMLIIQLISIVANLFFVFATGKGGMVSMIAVVISLILVGLNLFASISLIRYAGSVKEAEASADPTQDIELACKHQGLYFKYVSLTLLLTIVMMIFAVLAIAIPAYQDYVARAKNFQMQMQEDMGNLDEVYPQLEEYKE